MYTCTMRFLPPFHANVNTLFHFILKMYFIHEGNEREADIVCVIYKSIIIDCICSNGCGGGSGGDDTQKAATQPKPLKQNSYNLVKAQ